MLRSPTLDYANGWKFLSPKEYGVYSSLPTRIAPEYCLRLKPTLGQTAKRMCAGALIT